MLSIRRRLATASYRGLLRPIMFRSFGGDPEAIHDAMISSLAKLGDHPSLLAAMRATIPTGQEVKLAGIRFPGRVGLAAGLDKDGRAARVWGALGFAFAELGTITGHGQPGNDKPRVFRLKESRAIINRMGFNNPGAREVAKTLTNLGIYRGHYKFGIPYGISIGKTKVVPVADAVEDYVYSFQTLAPHADYFAINVSSPNTPGLRELQDKSALRDLLIALQEQAANVAKQSLLGPTPIFVKIAPDLTWQAIDEVLEVANETNVAGIIATNTTLSRDGIAASDAHLANETGGLSGKPLTHRALDVVSYIVENGKLPVIGVGGIMYPEDGRAMLDAGASLVQLYTGFIYQGPALIAGIERGN